MSVAEPIRAGMATGRQGSRDVLCDRWMGVAARTEPIIVRE